jgi:hypothetical protein
MQRIKDFGLKYTKALAAAAATAMTPVLLELITELSKNATLALTALAATITVALSPKNKETPDV